MARTTGGTPKAIALGAELRRARERTGLSTREVARQMHITHTKLGRWERGERTPAAVDVATLLAHLGVNGTERDRLLVMAETAGELDWFGVGVDETLAALLGFERTAVQIVDISPLLIPGLLQTADYAAEIMRTAGVSAGEADKLVTLRMGRRDVLMPPRSVNFVAVIGEGALRYLLGSPAVQFDQLQHLQRLARYPNVTIRVLPSDVGWTPALQGPFVVYHYRNASAIVHLEHHAASGFVKDAGSVSIFEAAADTVEQAALTSDQSLELIAALIQRGRTAGRW